MRKNYPSDISLGQLDQSQASRPVRGVLRGAVSAQERLPVAHAAQEFPKWRTVHSYFAIWSEPCEGGSLLGQALKKSGGHTGPAAPGGCNHHRGEGPQKIVASTRALQT